MIGHTRSAIVVLSILLSTSAFSLANEAVESLLKTHCLRCHGEEKLEADIDLRGPYDQLTLLKKRDTWERSLEQIELEDMPPKKPFLDEKGIRILSDWINQSIHDVDWTAFHSPGKTSLARITSVEYRNTIRDVFEVDLKAGHLLGNDPEGNTGFTNDRDALTFPLFAFDNFLQEAERTVTTFLGFGEAPWSQTYDLVEDWKASSDRSVELSEDKKSVLLKERNAPYAISVQVPFQGLYQLDIEAATSNGEPISAMQVIVNGDHVSDVIVRGVKRNRYQLIAVLHEGANVISFGYAPEKAPLLQKTYPPRIVPDSISRAILTPRIKSYPIPKNLEGNNQAEKAWKKLNNTIRDFALTERLAKRLLEEKQTDYEAHDIKGHTTRQTKRFGPSKVPFNLAAGSVAVFSKIPQKKLEQKILETTGFSHEAYAKTTKAYLEAWKKKHPERVQKNPGRIKLTQLTLRSHALTPNDSDPRPLITDTLESDESPRALLKSFGTRAYGRRITASEADLLESVFQQTLIETGSRREALRDSLVALLVSPPFLLHFTDQTNVENSQISQKDLAKRLSRFLWMSVPDQKLRSLAFRDQLSEPTRLRSEVDRMIEDPRFQEVSRLFVEQWLDLETLDALDRGPGLAKHKIPAMKEEPARLFHHVFLTNQSLLDLIAPDYTFVNGSLALHYGIDGIDGDELKKIAIKDRRRGGLVSMAGILTATSTPERTSPVTRGAFIVELLLGEELPPPPPSVPELKNTNKAKTLREELEIHRQDKACSGCHEKIDPYGFVLEKYDQFGAWRTSENDKPINTATVLKDGTKLGGVVDFKTYLVEERKEDFIRNITERVFEFALGREVQFSDEATLQKILSELEKDHLRARTLLYSIVESDAFQKHVESSFQASSLP